MIPLVRALINTYIRKPRASGDDPVWREESKKAPE